MKEGRFYSEEAKQIMVEKISTGNFTSLANAARSFGVDPKTLRRWLRERGVQYKGYTPMSVQEELVSEVGKQTMSEKKELGFLEPDPEPSTFRNDAERANYYMMRAYYPEELFRLCDLDEVSKKKHSCS